MFNMINNSLGGAKNTNIDYWNVTTRNILELQLS